jgi:chorismate mutase / prephenate dehydrogenase
MAPGPKTPSPDDPRSLPALRAMIDAVDHDVLQLLSRRNGLVAEIAAYKRLHGVAIRDARREREIIADRREHSQTLGLRPEVIESIFRLVLWASRDRQAALGAQLPRDVEPRTVAVIGGCGAMGSCMARLFADLGHVVMIADVATPLTPEEAAKRADVVVISVPIDVTVDVIRHLGPLVRPDALLMDVTSVKSAPVDAMMACSPASVVGTHPLFGPSVHSLQGQRVALIRGRGEVWTEWLQTMLEARGLLVVETDAVSHDRVMSIVQVLTRFATEVMGSTIAALGVPLDDTLRFTSPVYLMELFMTARHFAQSPDLYASIQMSNPETERITDAFLKTAGRLREDVMTRDRDAVRRTFQDVHEYFGEFTERAMEESSFMIDRLVERS